jgi:pSer/pThr/pTyr-binding forkhead associated (FHA) protein
MDVKLVVTSGKHAGQVLPVSGSQFLIGRGPDCQLRPGSREISAHHCEILVEQGRASVRDLDSATGTFLNGTRVTGQQELKNSDRLRIGQLEFEVQLTVTIGGKKKPKIRSISEAAARLVASASREEADVASWLNEPEEKQLDLGPSSPAEETDDPAAHKPIDLFGPQQQAKPSAGSSRDAAADLLRQMFGKK